MRWRLRASDVVVISLQISRTADSGGLQKEAFLCSVPCITIRRSTEWVETLDQGWNKLCAFDMDEIVDLVLSQVPEPKMNNSRLIFGKGNTSEIIRDAIIYS